MVRTGMVRIGEEWKGLAGIGMERNGKEWFNVLSMVKD